jgi:hypothetical protein
MRLARFQAEIVRPIVGLVAVLVVDDVFHRQSTPNHPLHDDTVFPPVDILAPLLRAQHDVSVRVECATIPKQRMFVADSFA